MSICPNVTNNSYKEQYGGTADSVVSKEITKYVLSREEQHFDV